MNDDGVVITRWIYHNLTIEFDDAGHQYLTYWATPALRTRRGVGVGTTKTRVLSLYGRPYYEQDREDGALLYAKSGQAEETEGITFKFVAGRVSQIIVGEVISVE